MPARNTSDLCPVIRIIPVITSEAFEIDLEPAFSGCHVEGDIDSGYVEIESAIEDGYKVENAGDWGLLDDIIDELLGESRASDWMDTLDKIVEGLYGDRVANYDVIAANRATFGITTFDSMYMDDCNVTVYDDRSDYEASLIERHREAYGLDASYPADYINQSALDAVSADDTTLDLPDGSICVVG